MPLATVASHRRAQVRWNTERWTVYLSSKMHFVLHLRSHDLCNSTLFFLHPQISYFSSKKTLVTLDCKKACSSSSRITYTWVDRFSFFKLHTWLAVCSQRHISVQDGHTWASSLYPDSTLGENTPSCITLILNWKPKRHQFLFWPRTKYSYTKTVQGPSKQFKIHFSRALYRI